MDTLFRMILHIDCKNVAVRICTKYKENHIRIIHLNLKFDMNKTINESHTDFFFNINETLVAMKTEFL